MKENPLIRRVRDIAIGKCPALDGYTLERVHGPEAWAAFERGWMRWRAIDKRAAVLFGHADNRHKTSGGARGEVSVGDLEEVFLHYRYAHGEGWLVRAELRLDEVRTWLANEATPPQRALFDALRKNPAAFEPENVQLAALLVHFVVLLDKLGRLPSRDELRETFPFGLWQDKRPPSQAEWQAAKERKKKTVLDAAERQAFKRNLKALGLEALPAGTLPQPLPEGEGEDPFDVLTGQA